MKTGTLASFFSLNFELQMCSNVRIFTQLFLRTCLKSISSSSVTYASNWAYATAR